MAYGDLSKAADIKKQTFVLTRCFVEEWESLSTSCFFFLVFFFFAVLTSLVYSSQNETSGVRFSL